MKHCGMSLVPGVLYYPRDEVTQAMINTYIGYTLKGKKVKHEIKFQASMYVCTVRSSFDIQYNIVVASTLILANLKYNNE